MNFEHANITVKNIETATKFIQLAFPEAAIRGGGDRAQGGFWRHVGTAEHYIALQQEAEPKVSNRTPYTDNGINHVGFVVENVDDVKQRLQDGGYAANDMGVSEEGRTSIYVFDDTGIEWEFVQYHSDDNSVKNHYE